MRVIRRITLTLGTMASIISLACIQQIPVWLQITLVILGCACGIILFWGDYKDSQINERVCYDFEEVEDAMCDIVTSQGKVCIVSRDLSWVTSEIFAKLIEKKRDILIFAQNPNETTHKLEQQGITIKYYGKYGFEPQTRFTIIRYNRPNPQVAIANTRNNVKKKKFIHKIYQTGGNDAYQDAWINSLALDMIRLLESISEEHKHEKSNA